MAPGPVIDSIAPWKPDFMSMLFYAIMVFGLVAVLLFLAFWLGERKIQKEKGVPFECGIFPTGEALFRYPVHFYLVAVFFLIFDVEAVYIFAWAVAVEPLGWPGFLQITFFIVILLVSLFYIWKKGGLEWGPARSSRR
jgi:NADH-quinone oxidoreductase subunit A